VSHASVAKGEDVQQRKGVRRIEEGARHAPENCADHSCFLILLIYAEGLTVAEASIEVIIAKLTRLREPTNTTDAINYG
jgi:hypothetical protein